MDTNHLLDTLTFGTLVEPIEKLDRTFLGTTNKFIDPVLSFNTTIGTDATGELEAGVSPCPLRPARV